MGEVSTIGLDIAKSVFRVHGGDSSGEVVVCKRVRPLGGVECGSDRNEFESTNHWIAVMKTSLSPCAPLPSPTAPSMSIGK
jgi:hypothetical protein